MQPSFVEGRPVYGGEVAVGRDYQSNGNGAFNGNNNQNNSNQYNGNVAGPGGVGAAMAQMTANN